LIDETTTAFATVSASLFCINLTEADHGRSRSYRVSQSAPCPGSARLLSR
jgi:hypothetical protein